jgi:hypothetical protein
VLVCVEEKHRAVTPEHFLRAVAVVDVEIGDENAIDAVPALSVPRADRDVVEDAEAHTAARGRVMSRRSNRAERVSRAARHDSLHARHDRSRSRQCGIPGAGRELRVASAERPPAGRDLGADLIHVGQCVNRENFVFACRPRCRHRHASQPFERANALEYRRHSLRTLGMVRAGLVLERGGVVEDLSGRGLSHKPSEAGILGQPDARANRGIEDKVATSGKHALA